MVLFKPKFASIHVNNLLRFYWVSQPDRMERVERDIESRAESVRSKQYLTRDEFRLVCSWTAQRAVGHYENNTETAVRETTARAFGAESESHRVNVLTELNGVSYTTASTILHFFHPNIYPIWSSPSLWSLGVNDSSYSFSAWSQYIVFFRQLVTEWDFSPRDVDRALWQYHYNKHAREVSYSDDD